MKGILIILFVFVNSLAFSQNKLTDEKRKEFEAQKVAFFTQELELSPAEAAKFWPLYNEMQKKIRDIDNEMRKKGRDMRETKNLTETQYKEAVSKMLESEEKMQVIKKDYYQQMVAVIPASKIWKLGEAERKFHRQLFDRLRRESAPKNK